MHVVLYNPEIPQNTGNIARTCAATGCTLHLIEPLGFSLSDRYLKRAGLDYWDMVEYRSYGGFDDLLKAYPEAHFYFLTTKAAKAYTDIRFTDDDFLVFGCETRGLPESLLKKAYDRCIRIPMREDARSLNLSNSVAIVVYEALRQLGFPALQPQGSLTGRDDGHLPWMDSI
jgi:tRNA (cytidine/uridine-2'-O-)-methyltransferase